MIILGIETSCDETAVCVLEASGSLAGKMSFKVLGNGLFSQAKIHAEYGGVFPALAKREHAKNLPVLLEKAVLDAGLSSRPFDSVEEALIDDLKVEKLLEREIGLKEQLEIVIFNKIHKPKIDAIAVTSGPGLEPALWVGINFALALGEMWNVPVYPTNHMAGHLFSPLISGATFEFPALALLISGGHTELVMSTDWNSHTVVGQTRDDAVGEAFDKVARLLGLPYPGGPEVSRLAQEARDAGVMASFSLPRPMLDSNDLAFSFSGLKTAVLYLLKKFEDVNYDIRRQVAREFEDAVTEVLVSKTEKAIAAYQPKTLIVAGGVSANTHIRAAFEKLAEKSADAHPIQLLIPPTNLTGDNAIMIAAAAYIDILVGQKPQTTIIAEGNLAL
jgi:N6-L-threonylcarbamoyladenine synthase